MQKADSLIRTKVRPPFTRPELVPRPRLQEQIAHGLRGPITLLIAPAGFGKTTLVALCVDGCGMPVAWLSLDKNDNQIGNFLSYLIAALQETDHMIGREAAQLMTASQEARFEAVLTSLINELDSAGRDIVLVLDDYQQITSRAVHEQMVFLLEHCPRTFHLVIATRSDPPLPLARLRACGHAVELRAVDLRFTETEAAQLLNDVMGLGLEAESVAALVKSTEGWVAGLQMASVAMQSLLSMGDREELRRFIEGFSGTNRYILDYLLEEVLASQPPEIQHFLRCTSILDRLTGPLCEAVLEADQSEGWGVDNLSGNFQPSDVRNCQAILEYLERANLFLLPLDGERVWYRYHHLFADLLRRQLQKSRGGEGVARLHLRAAEWLEQNDAILEAIQHASIASDEEMVERLIEQHYMEMVNRGEMFRVRFWMGELSKELIYRRPWLCLYEALSRSWFGQLDEAELFLNEAEKLIRAESSDKVSVPGAQSMLGYYAFVKSRVTAMQGDTRQAIRYCLTARENIPEGDLALWNEFSITLGYEYFLYGDFVNATKILLETIQSGYIARAINNPVAAYALLARMLFYQGRPHEAYDLLQKAAQLIQEGDGQHPGVTGLVEVGIAALLCEWNDLQRALVNLKRGLDCLPSWGKADDFCLAYTTLSRIQIALGNLPEAARVLEKATQLAQTCGLFSEARSAVETTQIKMWLLQRDWASVDRWVESQRKRLESDDLFGFENELAHITQARIFIAQNKSKEAIGLLSQLEDSARSAGRMGRLIEILLLKASAMQENGDITGALPALTECLTLAGPQGYVRVFLDEGEPIQFLLSRWLAHASANPLRNYAISLLSLFEKIPPVVAAEQESAFSASDTLASSRQVLIEPLSRREIEVLQQIAMGRTNQEIARQLVVSPGTIKAHAASIYRKLDVANRTEAVAQARRLRILT